MEKPEAQPEDKHDPPKSGETCSQQSRPHQGKGLEKKQLGIQLQAGNYLQHDQKTKRQRPELQRDNLQDRFQKWDWDPNN